MAILLRIAITLVCILFFAYSQIAAEEKPDEKHDFKLSGGLSAM
jgi:hypothetical protein